MKKLTMFTLLSLSCSLFAQNEVLYEIEPVIGYNSFDSGSKMESDFTYGVRATAYMNELYGYRVAYERADDVKFDVLPTASKKRTDLHRLSADLLINGQEEYKVIPYLQLGLGYEILGTETQHDVSQAYVSGGIGFKYMFIDRVNMNIETKLLKKFDTSDMDFALSFGIGYMLGGTLAIPEYDEPDDFKDTLKSKVVPDTPDVDESPKFGNHVDESLERDVKIDTLDEDVVEKSKNSIESVINKDNIKDSFASIDNDLSTQNSSSDDTIEAKEQTSDEDTIFGNQDDSFSKVEKVDSKDISDDPFSSDSLSGGYFIQMEAWFKDDYKTQLPKVLKEKGYQFEIRDVVRGGKDAKVVVIGPYSSFNEALKDQDKLKEIKSDAFITKL